MGLGITVVRTGAIVILVLILCWQSIVALFNFVGSPVGSKEALKLSEHTDYFPAITICPFAPPPIARSSMVSPAYTFTEGINNRSIKPKVHQSFYNVTKPDNTLIQSVRNATVQKTYVHVALYYIQECQTFTFTPDGDWYPIFFNVVLDMEELAQFTLYIHQHKDILPECTEPYGQFNAQIQGPAKPGTLQDRWFVVRDFKMNGLPRDELPCQEVAENADSGYEGGIGKCLYEYMEDEMKCKLPWTSDHNKDMPICSTNEHLMNFSSLSVSMMYFGESKYYQVTKCQQPCKYYYFKAKQMLVTEENTTKFGENAKTVAVHLLHPPAKMTKKDEYFVYDINYALGNVGGIVGLLVGASILTIIDYILDMMRRGAKKVVDFGKS